MLALFRIASLCFDAGVLGPGHLYKQSESLRGLKRSTNPS